MGIDKNKILSDVYKHCYGQLFHMAMDLCHNKQDAEDIVQNSFLKIISYNGIIESVRHMEILLVKIVKQRWATAYKKAVFYKKLYESLNTEEQMSVTPRIDFYPMSRFVFNKVGKLNPKEQHVLKSTVFYGLMWKEIPGIKYQAVSIYKRNALDNLKKDDPQEIISKGQSGGRGASLGELTLKVHKLSKLGKSKNEIAQELNLPYKQVMSAYSSYKRREERLAELAKNN